MLKSKPLELIELPDGTTIPQIDGKFYCSTRDPMKEALTWFKAFERQIQQQDEILVIGLGAGFHLLPLFNLNKKVRVFEIENELKTAWPKKELVEFVSEDYQTSSLVLEFRPAWTGNQKAYEAATKNFRGLKVQSLKEQAESRDLWILSQALQNGNLPENLEVTIKEIADVIPRENQTEEARIWRALRELVV